MEKTDKVYKKQLDEKIKKIVKKIKISKFPEEEILLYNLLQKVLLNEKKKINKNKLLKIIEEVNCYRNDEINDYIAFNIEMVKEKYNEIYFLIKNKLDSSNHSIISTLLKDGFLEKKNLIFYSKKDGIEQKDIKEKSIILIIDDYIGSGKSIIDILKSIENNYTKKKIGIISGIWQEKALIKIKEYITEKERKNDYIFYNDRCIKEISYIEKYKDNEVILNYIRDKCITCKDKDYKFGYKNTGAMITINGLSPNNNISLLWRDDLGNENIWIPPFRRHFNNRVIQIHKEKILKEPYFNLKKYYNNFLYKELFSFEEFKMLLLIFNSYSINIQQLTDLLGFDTDEETKITIEKFKKYGIIKYEIGGILEFCDERIIRQFKRIDQRLSGEALVNIRKGNDKNVLV